MRRIKGYKSISKERLLSALDESESAGSRNNFNNARIKKIREGFRKLRDRFLKTKIKEIRRNLQETENKKNLSKSKIKEIEQNLIELEESLFKLSKYYDYDDIKYKGIRDVENLFNGFAKLVNSIIIFETQNRLVFLKNTSLNLSDQVLIVRLMCIIIMELNYLQDYELG